MGASAIIPTDRHLNNFAITGYIDKARFFRWTTKDIPVLIGFWIVGF